MSHYTYTGSAGTTDLLRRLTAACERAGVTPPTVAAEVRERLATEPTVRDVETALAEEALDAEDVDAFTEDAITRMTRAHAAQAVREGLLKMEQRTLRTASPQLIASTVKAIHGAVAASIKALEKAAKSLPEDAPLDLEAVVAADATAAMKTAQKALADLAAYRTIHGVCRTESSVRISAVLPLVALPDVETERIDRINSRSLVKPSPERDAVRAFHRALEDDYDAALIALARGAYVGLSLSFATTGDELRERVARADRALIKQRGDSWGKDDNEQHKRVRQIIVSH